MSRDLTGGGGTYFSHSPAGVISPVVALSLDQKMDDGFPQTGDVIASSNTTVHHTDYNYVPHTGAVLRPDTTDGVCVNTTGVHVYNVDNNSDTACRLRINAKRYR